MVAIRSRFVYFLLLLAVVAVSVLAAPTYKLNSYDRDMIRVSHGLVSKKYVDTIGHWRSYNYRVTIPADREFLYSALQDADKRSNYIGMYKPKFWQRPFRGRQIYYYSVLKPESPAATLLQLPKDTFAKLVWKYDVKSKTSKLINIDSFEAAEIPGWDFHELKYILRYP